MRESAFIGWSGFALFVLAIAILVLLIFMPALGRYDIVSPEAGGFVGGVLALLATVIGFVGFKTAQGKVAAIGGLVLVAILGVVLPSSVHVSRPIAEEAKQGD